MKKIIFLLLISIASYGQAEFPEGVQITGGQPTVTSVNFLTATNPDGLQVKIAPENLPFTKLLNFTTPEDYGAVGDGVANDAAAFQNALNSGKMVLLGSKTYLLNSTINITSAVKILGAGNKSILKTTTNLPVINIASNLVSLSNFKIEGNGRGTTTNYATTRPLQNGVKIDGAYYNNSIDNVTFSNLGNAGIYGLNNQNGVSTNVTSSINVNSCFFFGNLFGINFDTLFEYNLVYNSVFKDNETGIIIKGGNNPIVGGHILNNRTGLSVQSGTNDAHSTASSVTINHNIEYGINVGAIVGGFTFSNCVIFFNPINLQSSTGVLIDGGLFKNQANLVFTNTNSTTLQNVKFIDSPNATLSGNINLRFFNNSYPDGLAIPASMTESITNLTNTNVFDVNATSSALNLIRMRVNSGNRYLLGSDSGITGGNDGDFNNYIYGNNNWLVYTNGVKRLTVSGSGLSTFTGNVAVPDGISSTHAINKGQLDAVAALDVNNVKVTGSQTINNGQKTFQVNNTSFPTAVKIETLVNSGGNYGLEGGNYSGAQGNARFTHSGTNATSRNIDLVNESNGINLHLNATSTSNGPAIQSQNNGTNTFSLDKLGNLTGNSYIKAGGAPTQILMADGSTSTVLSGSAVLNFPNTAMGVSSELTITVTGASDGDVVSLGVSNSASMSNAAYSARVSAANTVTVKFNNYSLFAQDPPSGTFKVKVFK